MKGKELILCYIIIFLLLVQLAISIYGRVDNSSKNVEKYKTLTTKTRLTNNCSYFNNDESCTKDPAIQAILSRGGGSASYQDECTNTYLGGCACTPGHNRKLCKVTGYFNDDEDNEVCTDASRDGSSYSC